MANMNVVILCGNLTRDPELRYTPKGTAIAGAALAINRQWKDEQGQEKEEVTFVDFDAWGRTAEVLAQYCKKGDPLLLEGRLKLDQWEDKQTGQKRSKLKVVVGSFQFLNRGDGSRREVGADQTRGQTAGAEAPQADPVEDEIPF